MNHLGIALVAALPLYTQVRVSQQSGVRCITIKLSDEPRSIDGFHDLHERITAVVREHGIGPFSVVLLP